ncbi:hypothetical protein [Candidatus Magnetaquicoccus inordinatus]|uniref:hypothetical protein n=1 Tax=Candidatus Magnetaquicoccus inordinatus TaxID=2496818 RepID=UPI00102CB21C|nr:hypothetical protein [Candidatus Magnetaquicoccus inordinatus]
MEHTESNNGAWITLHLPGYTPESFSAHVLRLEHLFRLNPFLRLDCWQEDGGALVDGWCVRMHFLNEMNGIEASRQLTWHPLPRGWWLEYDSGWKKTVQLTWEPYSPSAITMTLQEFYHPLPEGDAPPFALQEIDHSLFAWGKAIRRDLLWRRRFGWVPLLNRYLDWLPTLAPAPRRITRLLVWSSFLELLLFCLLLWFLPGV